MDFLQFSQQFLIAVCSAMEVSKSEDDFKAMAVELNTIAALCAGVRAFCAACGLEAPPLPSKPVPCQAAHFQRVSDYATGTLQTNRSIA